MAQSLHIVLLTASALIIMLSNQQEVLANRRSLLHWKHDLILRLNLYSSKLDIIRSLLDTSIQRKNLSGANVRFSDLIIPTGSLILDSHVARPTVKLLLDKTLNYVNSKMSDLYQIQGQLDTIKHQLDGSSQAYVYKGLPFRPQPHYNYTKPLPGTWRFRQVNYAHFIESRQVSLRQVNQTSVEQVIADTYMENSKFGLRDAQSRLFFEGRKTFWNTIFEKPLKSGCCDRLKPLHTNRMMVKSINQQVLAPVLLRSSNTNADAVISIKQLKTNNLYNQRITSTSTGPDSFSILPSPPENPIQLNSLISIRDQNQPELLKTLVFMDLVSIDEADLAYSYGGNKLEIGFSANPELKFDVSHDNYLLRNSAFRSNLTSMQQVSGRFVVQSMSHFVDSLDADQVNMIDKFQQFVSTNLVRIDTPAQTVLGPIQFNALPSVLNPTDGPSRAIENVLIMQIDNNLQVGLLNGMMIPQDVVVLPPFNYAIKPNHTLVVRGPRHFANTLIVDDFLTVNQLVNGMKMPQEVIPLHIHDSMSSIGYTNLAFVDGISAQHMTIQGGKFDEILLRDAYGDAQSLIMRSVFTPQPDGSQLIRAPLRVMNLRVFGQTADTGLLNGFRPEHLIELAPPQSVDTVFGQKTFVAPVEAAECLFSDINQLTNWTSHLIRIDMPESVQVIHKRMSFVQQTPPEKTVGGGYSSAIQANALNVQRLDIDFVDNNNKAHYLNNLNFSPEFYILQQALHRTITNSTDTRFRVLDQVKLSGLINGIDLNDIVTLDAPFRFADKFTMVGKVEIRSDMLAANRITSNYPIDAMDLIQFDRYRIPILGSAAPIRLNNLVLAGDNKASFVRCQMLNGIPFSEFANSIMSLTRPQVIDDGLIFNGPINFEGIVKIDSSLNGIKNFRQFANNLRNSKYSFENGLQCNSVVIRI